MTTLNPADKKSSLVVLSNGNLTVSGTDTGGNNWVRSTTAQTGKRYLEVTTTTVANTIIGIADLSAITFPGANAKSFGLFSNGAGSINGTTPTWGPTYASGNVVCMAVDFTAKKVWYRVGAGQWNGNSASHNPATNLGGWDISLYTGAANYFVVSGNNGMVSTVQFGGPFTQTVPTGFSGWDAAANVMPAGTGSYIYTGTAARTGWGRKMPAASSSYVMTGTAARLGKGRKVAANAGAYTYTGTAATLKSKRTLSAVPDGYVMTFPPATVASGRKMAAAPGSYIYTGFSANLAIVNANPGFQENAFENDAFQMAYDEVLVGIIEGADIASFTTTSTTKASFAIIEGPDVPIFNVISRTKAALAVTEGPDVPAFNVISRTKAALAVTEGPDKFAGHVLTGARFSFNITEGPDVPHFRTFATYWTMDDADWVYVPYENRLILIPAIFTVDGTASILVPPEKQTILVKQAIEEIGIRVEQQIANLKDEWQRVDVDQQGARRNDP